MSPHNFRGSLIAGLMAIALGISTIARAEDAPTKEKPAEFAVSGLGWFRNREMRTTLERLLGDALGPTVDANTIEDAVFMLISTVTEEGFAKPQVRVQLTLENGEKAEHVFDASLATLLPRPLSAKRVEFDIDRGVRSVIENVKIQGLTKIPLEQGVTFFKPDNALWESAKARAYSPGKLRTSADNLQEQLRYRGYASASVEAQVEHEDEKNGAVDVVVRADEGPRWIVSEVAARGAEKAPLTINLSARANLPWTTEWQQDTSEQIRRAYYAAGYPDVRVQFQSSARDTVNGEKAVTVTAVIDPGKHANVGTVRFQGNEHTKDSVLRRRLAVQPGEPLDPLKVERTRYRFARLGVFSKVDVQYEPVGDDEERDLLFAFEELPRWETNLLLGWGSYEQLRGGIEWRQMNVFGRAHQSRLELVQSFKSSRGEYTYTVPELFGERLDGTARLFALRREEQAFLRQEYGGSLTLRRRLPWSGAEARAGYTYQALRNADNELTTRGEDLGVVKVGSIDIGVTRDVRDNPLRPRSGYRWYSQIESASHFLGGEVEYQIYEAGGAYHTSWGSNRWIHAGLTHGFITTFGASSDRDLPVNKRFFPGGDSSVRGYQEGEAAPRGADGRFIGAKSQMTLNLELEQGLTSAWSAVVFFDAVGTAVSISDYPFNEHLASAGLGIRYQTIIGPVRVEYGRNLNPRPQDPAGTLHFSLGFPF